VLSTKRVSDLDTLLDFIQSATSELIWMNEKEEIEVSRDWSSKTLNISEIEEYQRALTIELEKREVHFNAVQDRGESLVLQKHPASKCIEAKRQRRHTKVYGVDTVSKKCVFEWFKRFRDGKEDVKDEPRSGRPPISTTPDSIEQV
ncbi:Dystonin, partial [Araneus ventricosus]